MFSVLSHAIDRFKVKQHLPLWLNPMGILTPYPQVVEELRERIKNHWLREKIERHYGSSFPEYFKDPPHLYLIRHIASPNFETLRFLHLVEPLGIPPIISQDPLDKFTSNNELKHALGKLPVCTEVSTKKNKYSECFENITVVDFNSANGKNLRDVRTVWGESLIQFHNNLFRQIAPNTSFQIHDESVWLPSRVRGNPLEYYKYLLPLFITHGILFEDYIEKDRGEIQFLKSVIVPAFRYVEKQFGLRPLITHLVPTSLESQRFWIGYPRKIGDIVRARMNA